MKIIGITGGVGSGKSKVLSYMEERFQAVICQTDHVAWDLQKPGQSCYKQIVQVFGNDILNEDQTINRAKLGQLVFADANKLQQLNKIMHPAVKSFVLEWIDQEEQRGTTYFVIESALLLEDNYQEFCHELWYIHADVDIRKQRLKENRQYDDEKIISIMSTQLSEEDFRVNCQVVIDNSRDFEHTRQQIEQIMKN